MTPYFPTRNWKIRGGFYCLFRILLSKIFQILERKLDFLYSAFSGIKTCEKFRNKNLKENYLIVKVKND